MNSAGFTAKGQAVFVAFLLYILPMAILAEDTVGANLVEVENLDSGPYLHRVSVQIGNRVEHLLLNPNPDLNDLTMINSAGEAISQPVIAYMGIVESLPASWARVVIDGSYLAGTINIAGENLHLSSEISSDNSTLESAEPVVMLPALTPPPQTERLTIRNVTPEEILIPVDNEFSDTRGVVTRVAQIGVVIDSLYNEAIGGRGLNNAIATMNSVDGLYRDRFGLALKVEALVLVTDDESLALQGNGIEQNLNLFRDYRIASELLPSDLDLVHLFTGINVNDNAIGLAFSGAACRTDGYDVSMSRPFLFPVTLTAHEIGHNLGAMHDDETQLCRAISDRLMFSEINFETTQQFSSCSADAINTRLLQSACYTDAIDISLDLTQLESNQLIATVTNLDETRAFPSAELHIDLENATIAEAPASCELEDNSKLTCAVPATFASETQELAIKLRLDRADERTVTMQLESQGFLDLNLANNNVELIIPGDPEPVVSEPGLGNQGLGDSGEITAEGAQGPDEIIADDQSIVSNLPDTNVPATGASSGGGSFGSLWMLLLLFVRRIPFTRAHLSPAQFPSRGIRNVSQAKILQLS